MLVRFTGCTADDAPCTTCCMSTRFKQDWRTAVWFVYFGNQNAVPLCAFHAITEMAAAWAMGDEVTIKGQRYEPPAPMLEALLSYREQRAAAALAPSARGREGS